MKRALVTGAGGALGRALIARMDLAGGYEVRGLTLSGSDQDPRGRACDVCDPAQLAAALDDFRPDVIFHLAATFSGDLSESYATNVAPTRQLLDLVRERASGMAGVRVVLIGSAAEYGVVRPDENPIAEDHALFPVSAYGVGKAWQTQLVGLYAQAGVDVVCARVFNLLGEGMSPRLFVGRVEAQIAEVLSGARATIEIGPLSAIRDYVSTEEAARQLLVIAGEGKAGEVYHVASGKPVVMRDLMAELLARRGLSMSIVRESPELSNRSGYDVPAIYADMRKTAALETAAAAPEKAKRTVLAVVTPVFNEEQVIGHFHARARAALDAMERDAGVDGRLIFVLDRSTDRTLDVLREIAGRDPKSTVIALSSRFGHQMSLLAGIEHAASTCGADAIVMLDSDLQHPPELILTLFEEFRKGADVVYTIRKDTEDVGLLRKTLGNAFYKGLSMLSRVPIRANAADFRLISRRVADALSGDFQERNMFLRGLFSWIGFEQVGVEFVAEKRFAGSSKYSLSRMLQLATAGILSFSTKPLHFGVFAGVGFAALAVLLMLGALVSYFIDRSIPSGWTTQIMLLLLFGGVQLIVIGILGAYVGGIFEEVKGRPRYIIDEVISRHD